jgi:hypothetical protein
VTGNSDASRLKLQYKAAELSSIPFTTSVGHESHGLAAVELENQIVVVVMAIEP